MLRIKNFPILFLIATAILSGCTKASNESDITIWQDNPALHWEEALPVGNGTQGAMIYGGMQREEFQLSDHTLWSGGPYDWNNPDAKKMLPLIRKAIIEEDYLRADTLWDYAQGPYSARYATAGSLLIEFDLDTAAVQNYRREINLEKGLSTVSFQIGNNAYIRESFASFPDNAIIVKLSATEKESLNFSAYFQNEMPHEIAATGNDHLLLRAKAPKHVAHRRYEPEQVVYEPDGEGMVYETHIQILESDGDQQVKDGELIVHDATEVVFAIAIATSFNGFDKSPGREGKEPNVEALQILKHLENQKYQKLKQRHTADFEGLFNRVSLDLGDKVRRSIPTSERLLRFNKGESDNDLMATFFQFGRYLMISSSRPGTVASNLQGLWNQKIQPPWGSNYTTNINVEMNYWPAEVTNLSECHEPMFDLIEKLSINGAETAKVNYGADGWVAHHNSDIWGLSAPTGGFTWDKQNNRPFWSCWPMAGGWMCQHLWTHYLYSGDEEFLKEKAWPLMRGSAVFYLDWLLEGPTGELVTCPSTSPENQFDTTRLAYNRSNDSYLIKNGNAGNGKFSLSMASTMDMAIIRDLFVNCIKALEVLQAEPELKTRLQSALDKLYAPRIGRHGQLQEWYKDWDNIIDDHRHVSHLYGLHPGVSIQPRETPLLAQAAKTSLQFRGDAGTGWARAWKINFWARFEDGEHAYQLIKQLFNPIDVRLPRSVKSDPDNRGGLYLNLLDACPPFQIDGNFGGTAGIAEMLLQSHTDAIHLLPALPEVWSEGSFTGFRTKGGFEIDMAWRQSKIVRLVIKSTLGGNCRIRLNHSIKETSRIKPSQGENSNHFFDNNGFVTPVISNELENSAKPIKVREVFEYDIAIKKGETYSVI